MSTKIMKEPKWIRSATAPKTREFDSEINDSNLRCRVEDGIILFYSSEEFGSKKWLEISYLSSKDLK